MRWIKLFENFSIPPQNVEFFDENYTSQFKPIAPNEKDYELYNEFYKAISKGGWCYGSDITTNQCFRIEQDLDEGGDEYFYASNGDDNWYVDIYKYSETGSPDTDPFEAWYVIFIEPKKDRTQNALKVKCDGDYGMTELIEHAKKYPGKIGKYFRLLDSFVRR